MKKPLVLIAAIVAVVGLGAAVAVAKEAIKVETSVSIRANLSGPHRDSLSGRWRRRRRAVRKGAG